MSSISSLVTPPSATPKKKAEWRFHPINLPTEWIESYRPGGFHPTDLGDTFKDGRYKIIRKVGYGSFSTVWLAHDKELCRYVALKILESKASATTAELSILNYLSVAEGRDLGHKHIITFLDGFKHHGPNGTHLCLVFEPMGGTTASMVDELPGNKPRRFGRPHRYPLWMAKRILKHALIGLAILHRNGIVHGDVQPGNFLFSATNLDQLPEDALKQDLSKNKVSREVRRLDGQIDRWAPRYLTVGSPLVDYADIGPGLTIKISDMGAAFFASDPPKKPVTPASLRAPELVLNTPFSQSIDIWSYGCLVYEFITGEALFSICLLDCTPEEIDDELLLAMTDVLGPLPDHLFCRWSTRTNFFASTPGSSHRTRINPDSEASAADGAGEEELYIGDSLEKLFQDNKPPDVGDDEARLILDLIRLILRYDPQERPSAEALLGHPWFAGD